MTDRILAAHTRVMDAAAQRGAARDAFHKAAHADLPSHSFTEYLSGVEATRRDLALAESAYVSALEAFHAEACPLG